MRDRQGREVTRRRYLGAFSTALATGVAGCSGVLGSQNDTREELSTTGTTTAPSDAARGTRTGPQAGSDNRSADTNGRPSPYTEVYQDTIGSVVLISVSAATGRGGQGSGFVFREGYVVTNAHVVSDAANVQVRFSKGQWRTASVGSADPSSDLAVLDVQNPPAYATPLGLVETQPPIGTEVVAIGNPYGLKGTVTSGLVSGVNRSIPAPNGYTIPDAIQTGAPVNPGNSGGPLMNLDGEVVGVINSGGGDNLAFAISAALVKRVVPSLIQNGKYEHAYMGVGLSTVTPDIAEQVGLNRVRGVLVGEVLPDGPSAGTLRQGDVIVGLNGRRIDARQQLSSYLALQASPGDTLEVAVLRNGERRTVELELGTRHERPSARQTGTPQR